MARRIECMWLAFLAIATALAAQGPAKAAEDLSSFGERVDAARPARSAVLKQPRETRWPAHVCAEIERVEKIVISGPLRPTDRGMARGGLLMLEQLHCGIDVSDKNAADLAILDEEQRRAQRDYDDNIAAGARAASRPQEPTIVEVPQAAPPPIAPTPPPQVNCITTRLGGGMSATTCR